MLSSNNVLESVEEVEIPNKRTLLWLSYKKWIQLSVFLGIIAVVIVAFLVFDVENKISDLLEWIDDHPVPGFFAFVGAYCLATVFFVPGAILSLGAGFIFGIPLGALTVWVGACLGQTFAFIAGRYLLREWVASHAQRFKVWRGLEIACEEEGWKIVSLLRLAPIIPYSVLNYGLGLTAVRFVEYTIASAIFIIPGVFLYVYLGSLAENIAEFSSGDSPLDLTTTLIIAAVSGVVIIITVVLTSYYAKRAINRRLRLNLESSLEISCEEGSQSQASQSQ